MKLSFSISARRAISVLVVTTALAGRTHAQYQPGPAPTIDDITSETVCTIPAPRTRTDIGIGEQVTCSVEPNSWSDIDTGPSGNVADGIGTVTWSATGQGTVLPTTGNSTTLTAKRDAGSAVVKATIEDAATFANDNAIEKTKNFTVKVPTGINVLSVVDLPLGGAGTNSIGAAGQFVYQVTPTSVNFKNAELKLDVSQQQFTFPSGYVYTCTASASEFGVGDIDGTNNLAVGVISSGAFDPALLIDATTSVAINFGFEVVTAFKYKNESSAWTTFENGENGREFRASDKKARVYADLGNTVYGGWIGPWNGAPTYP